MAVPRFLFVSGLRGDSYLDLEPPIVLSRLTGVSWRLLGANNRELGRSADVFAGLDACHEAALRLQQHLAELSSELRSQPSTGRWTWQLRLDKQPVAIAGRSYLRLRECQYNLTQFLAFAPDAGVAHASLARRGVQHPGVDPVVRA